MTRLQLIRGLAAALVLGAALLLFAAGAARADSLFEQPTSENPADSGLYAPHPVQLQVGDIVKVRVREKTQADIELGLSTKDQAKTDTKYDSSGNLLGRLLSPFLKLIGEGKVGLDSKHEFKNDGKTDRSSRLDGMVTALVTEKLDNGQLIIEGRKQVLLNSENQTLVVRGLIDPRDLDSDRVVDSDMIADVEISYLGEGQLSKKTKPGFLSRVIEAIF